MARPKAGDRQRRTIMSKQPKVSKRGAIPPFFVMEVI